MVLKPIVCTFERFINVKCIKTPCLRCVCVNALMGSMSLMGVGWVCWVWWIGWAWWVWWIQWVWWGSRLHSLQSNRSAGVAHINSGQCFPLLKPTIPQNGSEVWTQKHSGKFWTYFSLLWQQNPVSLTFHTYFPGMLKPRSWPLLD